MTEPETVPGGKFVEGVYLPEKEQHLIDWMVHGKKAVRHRGRITYQWGKQEAAMEVVKAEGRAGESMIDVGAHCGLWSMWWAEIMGSILAFEPIAVYRQLMEANMALEGHVNYAILPFALSDAVGTLTFRVDPSNTGGTRAYGDSESHDFGDYNVACTTLDSAAAGFADANPIGFLKIDCEGFEEKVLRGGAALIETHRPVIVVEQKFEGKWFGFKRKGAVDFLKSKGYREVKEIGGDHIMVPV